jgi:hypothetical protein
MQEGVMSVPFDVLILYITCYGMGCMLFAFGCGVLFGSSEVKRGTRTGRIAFVSILAGLAYHAYVFYQRWEFVP